MSDVKRFAKGWNNYELIDAGGGKKLERWGEVITIRPEVQAYFSTGKPFSEWQTLAHWEFIEKGGNSGTWKQLKKGAPEDWYISYKDLTFELSLTKFKHVGIFPEQCENWEFLSKHLNEGDSLLNLFAYTGAASVISRRTGAEVVHCDSVKQLITWARNNMENSGLEGIRWVHEDALKFASRELKRGKKYKGLIMDPPAWGIGARNEKWKLEDRLESLVETASQLIEPSGFLILNTYSPKVDLPFLHRLNEKLLSHFTTEINELWMETTTGKSLYYGNLLRAVRN